MEYGDPAGWRLQKLSFELEVISFISATHTLRSPDLKLLLGDNVTGSRSTEVLVVSSLDLANRFQLLLSRFCGLFGGARSRCC